MSKYFLPEKAVEQAFKAITLFPELIYCYKATVERWKDGDSLVLDIDRGFKGEESHILKLDIRLARADTFECNNSHEKKLGERAKRAVKRRYPKGYEFYALTEKDRTDFFDRYLVHLYDIKRENIVCTWLIENNHATEYKPKGKWLRYDLVTKLKNELWDKKQY